MTILADVGVQDAEVVMCGSVQNIGITVKDENDILINPQVLSVCISDLNGATLLEDVYSPIENRDPNPPRIINPTIGRFEFPFGLDNESIVPGKNNKTNIRRDVLFTWKIKKTASTQADLTVDPGTNSNALLDWTALANSSTGNFISIEYVSPGISNQSLSVIRDGAKITVNLATNNVNVVTTTANDIISAVSSNSDVLEIVNVSLSVGSDGTGIVGPFSETNLVGGSDGSEEESICTNVRIITTRLCSLIHKLRLMIDKVVKNFTSTGNPDNDCYLGYSKGQLAQYIEEGLQIINAYQPSGCFSLDNYPYQCYEFTLIEAALMAGVMSQQLFAIDTDIPSWSDQGNAFVIQHQPQLASYLTWLSARLDKMIPMMKLNFVSSGSLHIQAGPNFRLATLLNAAPTGALLRNLYFRG